MYIVGSKNFRPDTQKPHQMENAVRDICIVTSSQMWKVWIIAKLFYFCHLKKLVRLETFGPYYVYVNQSSRTIIYWYILSVWYNRKFTTKWKIPSHSALQHIWKYPILETLCFPYRIPSKGQVHKTVNNCVFLCKLHLLGLGQSWEYICLLCFYLHFKFVYI